MYYITDMCVVSLDLQTADVGSIVSITRRPNQLGMNEIAIVTSLLENQTAIAAGNANVSEPQTMMSSLNYRDSIGKTLTVQEECVQCLTLVASKGRCGRHSCTRCLLECVTLVAQ